MRQVGKTWLKTPRLEPSRGLRISSVPQATTSSKKRRRTSRKGFPLVLGALCNSSEQRFKAAADTAGWAVTKRGWPDFILRRNGRLCFVEVKPDKPKVRPEQQSILEELAAAGFPCFIWTPNTGFVRVSPSSKVRQSVVPEQTRTHQPLQPNLIADHETQK